MWQHFVKLAAGLSRDMENAIENGNWWNVVTRPYTDHIGSMFFVTVYFLALGMIYLKSRNALLVAAVMMSLSTAMAALFAVFEAQELMYIFTAFAITGTIFFLFVRRRGY